MLGAAWGRRFSVGNGLGSDAGLLGQGLFGSRCIDFDRQTGDERARADSAGKNHRTGDDEFQGAPIFCRGNKYSVFFQ